MNKLLLAALLLGFTSTASAQHLTLQQAVNRTVMRTNRPKAMAWNEAGMPYEAAANNHSADYDSQTADHRYALDYTNTRRVWRYNTRGDYYLVNLKTGSRRQLGQGLPESSLQFAKFSPDGTRVAYVSRNNIYMEYCDSAMHVQKGRIPVTSDGNASIINGTFDWVYEEELDLRDGFRWSGDSRYIAYWQSDTEGTGYFQIINNVDSIYPTLQTFPYPKAGTTNSAVRIGFTEPGSLKTMWLNIPGEPRQHYLAYMEFAPGTDRLMVQQLNRAQNTNKVWVTNLPDNTPQLLCTDTDSAWVEPSADIHFLQDNRYFTFTSERDGWRHIYRVSADGKQWKCLTPGAMDVVSEVALDTRRGYLYYTATDHQATQRYLFRCRLDGKGKPVNISLSMRPKTLSDNVLGQYSYTMSDGLDHAVESFSNALTPPEYRTVSMDKKGVWHIDSLLLDNHALLDEAKTLGIQPREMVKCKSGDLMLDAWVIKPANFDPQKKYPVICYIYGEPASATVQDRWEPSLFWQYLAQQGYVVVSIDPRGANTPRGRQWRKCIYGEVGVAASQDIANGMLDLCRQFPWMDRDRLGVTGWSGGGSQTLNCMFRFPDVFKAGIAIAFVADQRLYDTIYQERYMNTPQANPDGYFRASPVHHAEGLKGRLLLVHGTGDDNVHYQNCERMVNELIRQGKVFYQLSYPLRTHSIYEGEGTSLHLRQQLLDFWQHNL